MKSLWNKKRIISLILVVTLSFLFISDIKSKETKADTLSLATGFKFVSSGTLVSISGPVVAGILVIAIGMGLYFENEDEIQSFIVNLYNKAKSTGKDILTFFKEGINNITVSKEGVQTIHDSITSDTINTTLDSVRFQLEFNGSTGETSIRKTQNLLTLEPNKTYHLTYQSSFTLESGKATSDYGITMYRFFLGDKSMTTINPNTDIRHLIINTTDTWVRSKAFTEAEFNSKTKAQLIEETNSLGNYATFNSNTFSIQAELREGVIDAYTDVKRVYGDSIGNTQSVSADGFLDGALSKEQDISVSIPTTSENAMTLDNVISKTYDDIIADGITIENTGDVVIPGETPGIVDGIIGGIKDLVKSILDMLKSILDFLGGLLESLINAIKGLLISLFVPTLSVSDLFSVPTGSGFSAIVELFNFDNILNLEPKAYEFETNIPMSDLTGTGNNKNWNIKINLFDNPVLKNNINLVRNVMSYSILIGVVYFIVYHFIPKRDMD